MDPDELITLGSATLGESGARTVAAGTVRPVWPGAAAAGPALPVRCAPDDNLAIHVALATAEAGAVLVVHVEGVPDRGYFGEVMTVAAQARGVAGLVIDACVRDTAAISARRFPVFSGGVALIGTPKAGPGAVGAPITIGGAAVARGQWVVADDDGVVVLDDDGVAERGRARHERELAFFAALAGGATTLGVLGIADTSSVEVAP